MTTPALRPDPGPPDAEAADWAALRASVRAVTAPVPEVTGEPPYRVTCFGTVRGSVAIDDPQLAAQLAWAAARAGATVKIAPAAHPDGDLTAIVRRKVVDELPAWARLLLGGAR